MTEFNSYPLAWVGGFIDSIRQYIHLRKEDRLIILLPNQAYKLNTTAINVLDHLLSGGDIEEIISQQHDSETVRQDLYYFFCDLKSLVSGCMGDGRDRKAVDHVPYEAPFSKLPILSEIAVTYRCNLACRFCYAGCNCRTKPGAETDLDTASVKKILDIFKQEADVPSVSFTGGEPTLRDDLPELIKYARTIGMRVNLISNGTRITEEYAGELHDAGLNSAQISIEGPDAQSHDHLTQVPGSFEKTWRGIAALVAAGINTQTNTTLNSYNADFAEDIVDLIHENGLKRFAMNILTPSGSAMSNRNLFLKYEDIGPIVQQVNERAKRLDIEFLWYSPTPYCLFNPITEGLGNKSCAACDGLLSVDPGGNILPCSSFETGVGNILEDDFLTIWNSAQATFWRHKEYAPTECNGCDSILACAAACPLYWEACGTAELQNIEEVAS